MKKTPLEPEGAEPQPDGLARTALIIGSLGLLVAMLTDGIAVLGRHAGFSLIGALELVEAAIVLVASASLVLTTREGRHASVHVLTERLAPARAARLARLATLLSSAVILLLLAGSVWVLLETWSGHERSELLHIPLRWLRLLWILSLGLAALLFLAALRRRSRP